VPGYVNPLLGFISVDEYVDKIAFIVDWTLEYFSVFSGKFVDTRRVSIELINPSFVNIIV
jgi:hypothetical protein